MANKLYDVAIKTGEYTNNQGQKKSRYENVGVIMQGEHGPYLVLKDYIDYNRFSKDGRIIMTIFEPKDNQQQSGGFKPNSPVDPDSIPF